MIGINARVYNPVVIDSSDNVKFMNPNASYNMSGTEKYVNSGWFLQKGQEQAFPGSGNTFTVTFDKRGIYEYMCILHPWMAGSVAVKQQENSSYLLYCSMEIYDNKRALDML